MYWEKKWLLPASALNFHSKRNSTGRCHIARQQWNQLLLLVWLLWKGRSYGLLLQLYKSKEKWISERYKTWVADPCWGMTCLPLVTEEVLSVYKDSEALAELSGCLDKALLLQWHERLANNRGSIFVFFGFNSFNYICCKFSNQWVYQLHKEKYELCV